MIVLLAAVAVWLFQAPKIIAPKEPRPQTPNRQEEAPVNKPKTLEGRPQGEAPPAPAPAAWELKDERDFENDPAAIKNLEPWYTTNSGSLGGGLNLHGDYDHESYFQLNARTPNAVKWELTVRPGMGGGWTKSWQLLENGFYLATQDPLRPLLATSFQTYEMSVEREGGKVKYGLNGLESAALNVPAGDRTPLKAAADACDLTVLKSKLYFKTGDVFSDPPPPAASQGPPPQWIPAYKDDFDTAECVKRYFKLRGEMTWHEKQKALMFYPGAGQEDVFAAVHKSLPGDLRIRFKALRRKSADQVHIGVMFNLCGALHREDGYFVEWARGIAQIKKRNHCLKVCSAPTPQTPDRWVDVGLTKAGPAITMSLQDKTVLEWNDPYFFADQTHDLVGFYVWSEGTLIKDLVIERNHNDPLKPLDDDPATEDNLKNSTRNVPGMPELRDF